MIRSFKVATFYHPELRTKVSAYTRIYNTEWEGCRVYDVEAESGKEAKKIATKMRLEDERRARLSRERNQNEQSTNRC